MGDHKAVLAQLPPCNVKHAAKLKEIRAHWDQGCSKQFQGAHLTHDERIKVVMDWLGKAGLRDYVLGELLLSFARPLPVPPTDEQRKERRQKALVRDAYHVDVPQLRAVTKVVIKRLETVDGDTQESLATLDSRDNPREKENPGTMFAEFAKTIEDQLVLDYKSGGSIFEDAAE